MEGERTQSGWGPFGVLAIARWRLWRLPDRFLVGYVLAVDLTALTGAAAAFHALPVPARDWRPFWILLACCVVYVEVSRSIDRSRADFLDGPHIDLNSVWMFAAALLLHPGLAAVVISVSFAYRWLRVRHRPVYRQTFSAAASIVSAYLANLVPFAPQEFAIFGAALIYGLSNTALITFAVYRSRPGSRLREAMFTPADYALEAATIALGVLLAWALVDWPPVLVLIMGVTLVLHRSTLVQQFREQAGADGKTGLLNAAKWTEVATGELARGRRRGLPSSVLMVDLDHFKAINDRHGHLTGDQVLRAVAAALRAEVRAADVLGRFGGEEFAILLPGTNRFDAVTIAERIRRRVGQVLVPVPGGEIGITASIGVAAQPRDGHTLESLLAAADRALYVAKDAGRDRVRTMP
ncbi:GGDEF domain-containing protein [Amycolatopsis albispora]|uniref:GGDEF domain-containing protein n=1 Tax=Amycolatopsis albispora TaxID=1804986 RepID=UPI001F00AE59|nr:diguanylate cyclase [Amycolatopsis albispora]